MISELRKSVIIGLYNIANATADKFIVNNLNEFKLGGEGIVVLVDTYPDVNSNIGQQEFFANAKLILCLAEIKVSSLRPLSTFIHNLCPQRKYRRDFGSNIWNASTVRPKNK